MIVMTVHTSRRTFLYSKIMIIVTVHTDCFLYGEDLGYYDGAHRQAVVSGEDHDYCDGAYKQANCCLCCLSIRS